ncbi:MAG: hypothetical protein ABNH02_00525 [Pseudomonadales bacterium]|jgi:outer membrane protein OmpA-like peptidoglycan-associated protein
MKLFFSLALTCFVLALAGCSSSAPPQEHQPSARLGDDDRDGVINQRDLCPATISNRPIDEKGCDLTLTNMSRFEAVVVFEADSTLISLDQQEVLARNISEIEISDIDSILLEGTSSSSEIPSEALLIERRVVAVKDFLRSLDIQDPIGVIPSGQASTQHNPHTDEHARVDQRVYIMIYLN